MTDHESVAFPAPVTLIVGLMLLILTVLIFAGFYWSLTGDISVFYVSSDPGTNNAIRESLVTVFAAGVGSLITTILGYLEHACEAGDFNRSFAPWYLARPIMGMLLGLVFYFVIKGGLLVLVPKADDINALNLWGVAGFGALVGLFNKKAIIKLEEVFDTIFKSENSDK